jgi:hypothetical protein
MLRPAAGEEAEAADPPAAPPAAVLPSSSWEHEAPAPFPPASFANLGRCTRLFIQTLMTPLRSRQGQEATDVDGPVGGVSEVGTERRVPSVPKHQPWKGQRMQSPRTSPPPRARCAPRCGQ